MAEKTEKPAKAGKPAQEEQEVLFTGKIEHTKKTIQALYRTEYYTYSQKMVMAWMLVGMVMIVLAITAVSSTVLQVLLLLVGCWMLISKDFPSQMRADQALEARHGSLPVMNYEFQRDYVRVDGEGKMKIPYAKFHRLIEDQDYLYLFLGRGSVCMLDRSTVQPDSDKELKRFVTERTGKQWSRNWTLLSMTLGDLLQMRKERGR